MAAARGVEVLDGVAEELPYQDDAFDFALMVTTICFLDDVEKSLREARRVVRPGGRVVVALVDKESPIGRLYQENQEQNVFYRHATFYTTDEVRSLMEEAGLRDFRFSQTIFRMLEELTEPEEVREGYGDGSFVVVSALA